MTPKYSDCDDIMKFLQKSDGIHNILDFHTHHPIGSVSVSMSEQVNVVREVCLFLRKTDLDKLDWVKEKKWRRKHG